MKKSVSIKVSDFISITKPTYIYYKLTPTTNTRNHKTDQFENMINKLYMDSSKRFERHNKKLIVNTNAKISYYVYLEKGGEVSFYFIIPEFFKSQFKDKISGNWNGVAITEVDKKEVPTFSSNCSKYAMNYTKEDGLSLETNKANNHLIDANINVLDILEEGDKVGIFYNFQPVGWYQQKTFQTKYHDTMNKLDNMKPVDKNKNDIRYIAKSIGKIIYDIVDGVLNPIGRKQSKSSEFSSTEMALLRMMGKTYCETSNSTKKKETSKVVKTQIVLLSESKDNKRQRNNGEALCNSFSVITGDNSLAPKKIKYKKFDTDDMENFNAIDAKYTNIMSDLEISNHISLPSKDKLREKDIECITITEKVVPEELRQGDIFIGDAPIKGSTMEAYISDDEQIGNLPICLLGAQGSGKSTLMENISKDIIESNESLVVIDFIKECELSENIKKITPKDKLIELDVSTLEGMQGFGFNEVKYDESMPVLERLKIASKSTSQVVNLVNAINDCGDPLSTRMRRFLTSACMIALIHPNQSLLNIIEILEDFNVRNEYIENIPSDIKPFLSSKINALNELNEIKNNMIVGTVSSKIEHILDRVNLLREDFILETMFNKSIEDNIDFVDAINEGKIILIKMPESEFPTKYVKNILVTYFMSKIWLANQLRKVDKKSIRCNILVDEIFQSPTAMNNILKPILPQSRKFKMRTILSFHYFKQVDTIEESLKASGSSFMLLQGTEKANFKSLDNEFGNLGYDVDTLLNLNRYHSLNLIRVNNGYSAFVTKLPKPIA